MALLKAAETVENRERVMSLSHLQSLMKKDPPAYEVEFDQQWKHFTSQLELFKLKPQKPHGSFGEQVMFLAHVGPSFPGKGEALPGELISALDEHYEVMHSTMREVLVQALILLRNRNQFPCTRTLPLYFKLFALSDKALRKRIFTHVVRDITQMNVKSRSQKANRELRDLCFARLRDGETEIARRACAIFISLFRKAIWKDPHTINLMSAGLVHRDVKISAALSHLFLGNKTKGLEDIMDESDDEGKKEKDDLDLVAQEITQSRSTGRREKRLARAKKAAKRVVRKRKAKEDEDTHVNFVAIDLLHDPHTLAERLLQRVSKPGEPFSFRVLLLHLVCRVVNRHLLLLPNLYAFLLKYLNPGQQDVTQIMACLVEATHPQVPPDDLRNCVLHVMRQFVTEAQMPEVIEVGLNSIREVCARSVTVLTEAEVADLAGFRRHKNKGVIMACRSLINLYREKDPELLHRSLRGRHAAMALSRGEIDKEEYGKEQVYDTIDGLDLLFKKKRKRAEGDEGEEEGRDPKAAKSVAPTKAAQIQIMTDRVLGEDDFKKLRKLRLQKSVELQLGRKRTAEEMSDSSGSGSDSDSESNHSDGERGMPGRMPDGMSAGELKARAKKARTKNERIAKIKEGRKDHHAMAKESRQGRKGGRTNAEHKRNKPLMMSMQSATVKKKQGETAKNKMSRMKKHIKRAKSTKNHQKIARRAPK